MLYGHPEISGDYRQEIKKENSPQQNRTLEQLQVITCTFLGLQDIEYSSLIIK